jgi:hypothetical protein
MFFIFGLFLEVFDTFFERIGPIWHFHAESLFDFGLVQNRERRPLDRRRKLVRMARLNVASGLPAVFGNHFGEVEPRANTLI